MQSFRIYHSKAKHDEFLIVPLLLLAVRAQVAGSLSSRQNQLRRGALQVVRLAEPGHQVDEGGSQVENVV